MRNHITQVHTSSVHDIVRLGLISDLHFGSSSLYKPALRHDFEMMCNLDAKIFLNGDVWDAILPSDIKRFDLKALDPELLQLGSTPLDAALEMAYEFLKPYATHIEGIGIGNHEAHVEKRHHICLTSILIDRLNQLPNVNIMAGGWCGFWNIQIFRQSKRTSWTLYRHHGAGGAAPVTKGVTDFQRMMAWHTNIDALWLGHKHNRYAIMDMKMHYDSQHHRVVERPVTCVMTGSYLSTYGIHHKTKASYAAGWNLSPQPMGGAVIELRQVEKTENKKTSLTCQSRVIL